MVLGNDDISDVLIQKLSQFGALSDQDRSVIQKTTYIMREVEADQDIVRQGGRPLFCPFLLDGFTCRYKLLADGQRQIIAFNIPGDFSDLTSLLLDRVDYGVATLTAARVVALPYAVILEWTAERPALARAIWGASQVSAALLGEWVVSAGRRTAQQRTAHLLCELVERMRHAGIMSGDTVGFPFTQVELADALGLTAVHVNRTLQGLRAERTIDLFNGTLSILNWRELRQAASFDPSYLHLRSR
jgi:CRP-like cAMP-binding protein